MVGSPNFRKEKEIQPSNLSCLLKLHTPVRITVSVIIPILNAESFLEECVNSVLNQTLKELEILLVDDRSTDSSRRIALSFAEKDERVKVTSTNELYHGVSAARNMAIKLASGEFVAFLDADDFFPSIHSLQLLVSEARRSNSLIVGGSLEIVDSNSRQVYFNPKGLVFDSTKQLTYNQYQHDGGFYRFIYNRQFLLTNKIFFPYLKRGQDFVFFVRALTRVGVFTVIPETVYAYRKGHKEIVWSRHFFIDHMVSVSYLLRESSTHAYPKLHTLMLKNSIRSIRLKSGELSLFERFLLVNKLSSMANSSLFNRFDKLNLYKLLFSLWISPLFYYIINWK